MAQKEDKLDWFPLYVYEFITDVSGWTNRELGVYFRLLCHQWINSKLPVEKDRLCLIAQEPFKEFEIIWNVVGTKFMVDKNGRYNSKLEKIRLQQQAFVQKKSEAGKAGAAAKWNTVIMPFNSQTFKDAWNVWIDYKKKEHRFTFKSTKTMQMQLDRIKRLSNGNEETAIDLIINAIEMTWKGIYPLPKSYANRNPNITKEGIIAALKSRY